MFIPAIAIVGFVFFYQRRRMDRPPARGRRAIISASNGGREMAMKPTGDDLGALLDTYDGKTGVRRRAPKAAPRTNGSPSSTSTR